MAEAKRVKRTKHELFAVKAQTAVAKLKADFAELRELSVKYRGAFTADQKEAIFKHIEENLQIPCEQAFNAALEGKAVTDENEFTLAPAPTPAT